MRSTNTAIVSSHRSILFFLVTGLVAFAGFAQVPAKKAITIDDMVAARASRSITPIWSPTGSAFVFQQDDTVQLYTVATRASKEWFKTPDLEKSATPVVKTKEFEWQNRRVASDTYQWYPNGKDLLVSAGGDLFKVDPAGKCEQITKTDIAEEDPKLSPDGKQVVYRWKSNLYVLDLASKRTVQLTNNGTPTLMNGQLDWVYPEELDLGSAVWWSPDSRQIAYLQFDINREFIYPQADLLGERALAEPERYPQAGTPNANVKLGVVSPSGAETKWMNLGDTSNGLVARVAWLPDSSSLAVERFTRLQDQLDLLFCNPATGETHSTLHEQSKTWLNVADNLSFLKTRPEFLWTSERNGFRHIYRYSNKGELLGQITNGEWQVNSLAAVDEARDRIYFTSSEASPLESHLYSVGFPGGQRTQLTKDEGVHTIHANSDGALYLDSFSNLTHPPETSLFSVTGERLAVIRPADLKLLDEHNILPTEIVKFKADDRTVLYARLIKPDGFDPAKKYPAIVFVYGGPGVQSVRNTWYGLSWEQVLAHRGYVIWQLDNRGSNGRGHAFEEPIFHELGKREVADQRLGVDHLVRMGFVDAKRIGITGWSYGGYMTIHSLLLAPDVFKVGVAGAPVTDWHNYDTIYTERYMGFPESNKAGYGASSNVKNAAKLEGKLLIVHNVEDDNVLFQNSMQMAAALERANKLFYMQLFPQKTHAITGSLRKSLYETMTEFFDKNLKAE